MSQLQKLSFIVDLLDRVSGPARTIQKRLTAVADSSRAAFEQVATGGIAIAGAGYSLQSIMTPVIGFNRAMGDLRSLDVAEDALESVSSQALQFSMQYGRSAEDFVASSYDIQSAIAGLQGNDLASFTNASNVLAAATKADAGTITNYMGTMYGIFKNQADAMGKSDWVEQMTGRTAAAVQMFKTTGTEMSSAFTSLGANATSAGIDAAEQMAILGTLQATMSGSEAGTKYKAFLAGVGNAQKQLGLQFTDADGNMLGMVDILDQLKGKFGDTFDVAEGDLLKKAFGSDEAVSLVKQLMADTGGLADSIQRLDNVTGMQQAEAMATARTDVWMRLSKILDALKVMLGNALLPILEPIGDAFAWVGEKMASWGEKYPWISRLIGIVVLGVISLTAVLGMLAVAAGLSTMATIGWGVAQSAWNGIMRVSNAIMAVARGSMLLLNAAMFANPVGLVVLGIAALISAIGAAIYWWDDLKAAFMDTSWGTAIVDFLQDIVGWISSLGDGVAWVMDSIGFSDDAPTATISSSTLDAPRRTSVAPGGVTQHMIQTANSSRTETRTIGTVHIHTNKALDAQALGDELAMGAL